MDGFRIAQMKKKKVAKSKKLTRIPQSMIEIDNMYDSMQYGIKSYNNIAQYKIAKVKT